MRTKGMAAFGPPATLVVAGVWLVLACALGGMPGGSPSPAASLAATAPGSPPPTKTPLPRATDASAATATPSATGAMSPGSGGTASPDAPPDGVLTAGTTRVSGHLGTFCWAGVCADEFQMPPASSLPLVDVSASQSTLKFELQPATGFVNWSASYSDGTSKDLEDLGQGGSPYDPDSSATPPADLFVAGFGAPPSGDWIVVVSLHFADRSTLVRGGDANYAWHVVVH